MRIPTGEIDRYIYFVGVDSTDLKTRETGLSSFTVYGSLNGAAAAAFTTPTINETDSSNMPGVYELLLDEQTTLTAGNDSEELCLHITHAGMAPVTRTVEIYRPKYTEGSTFSSTLDAILVDTADMQPKLGSPAGASISADLATIDGNVDSILTDTADMQPKLGSPAGASISADIATVDGVVDAILVDTADMQPKLGTPAGADICADLAVIDGNVDDIETDLATVDGIVDAILVDTGTTLPATLAGTLSADVVAISGDTTAADNLESYCDGTTPQPVNVTQISGSATAADNLEASAEVIVVGTVSHNVTAATTTVFYSDDITEATADHFIGRIVIFTSGALLYQATDITDYALVSSEGEFTVTALTEAPADNVTFVIV